MARTAKGRRGAIAVAALAALALAVAPSAATPGERVVVYGADSGSHLRLTVSGSNLVGDGSDEFVGNGEPDLCYSQGARRNRCVGGGGEDELYGGVEQRPALRRRGRRPLPRRRRLGPLAGLRDRARALSRTAAPSPADFRPRCRLYAAGG